MTDKEYIAYLVAMMSEQQYPCNICEIGWRDEVCPWVDSTDRTNRTNRTNRNDQIACIIEGMRKWAELKEKDNK